MLGIAASPNTPSQLSSSITHFPSSLPAAFLKPFRYYLSFRGRLLDRWCRLRWRGGRLYLGEILVGERGEFYNKNAKVESRGRSVFIFNLYRQQWFLLIELPNPHGSNSSYQDRCSFPAIWSSRPMPALVQPCTTTLAPPSASFVVALARQTVCQACEARIWRIRIVWRLG